MSLRALPIIFINFGGEMVYILDQRLTAQNIPSQKAHKVLDDIIGTMHNSRFVEELFRPQELYNKPLLKHAFEKLAHASIMRLNQSSMDKLYDLITMAFKYQLISCPRPSDLLLVTLNHLDSMIKMVNSELILIQMQNVYRMLITTYGALSESEFQHIRYTLLGFLQDTHIRVSMLLRDKTQNPNGRFIVPVSGPVPAGTEIPGSIRLFNSNGDLFKITHFQNGGQYLAAAKTGSLEPMSDRGTLLGTNMYTLSNSEDKNLSSPNEPEEKIVDTSTLAKEELNLLTQLISGAKTSPTKAEFRLNLFDLPSENESDAAQKDETKENILNFEPIKENKELQKIMGEMNDRLVLDGGNDDENDLLKLMDSACK